MKLTLGSLFDGSGGFPLAGVIMGIIPVWASEIEPYPIRVTRERFPGMQHLGDITKLRGNRIPPVDIITFGSPCQNLSIAGNQTGLHGSKSSLFFEAIRIIREMREATNNQNPRFIIWENVDNALSTNASRDFHQALQEVTKTVAPGLHVPGFHGKPAGNGQILGDKFSIAWRVLDAQYWGVPQRRRRVFLTADYHSRFAPRICFERESVPWNVETQGRIHKTLDTMGAEDFRGAGGFPEKIWVYTKHSQGELELNLSPTLDTDCWHVVFTPWEGSETGMVARQFTPIELARLQGFPDWWTQGLERQHPTPSELEYWHEIWVEYAQTMGKTNTTYTLHSQALKDWLADNYQNMSVRKMWGNGVALPNVVYILHNITRVVGSEPATPGFIREHINIPGNHPIPGQWLKYCKELP